MDFVIKLIAQDGHNVGVRFSTDSNLYDISMEKALQLQLEVLGFCPSLFS